MESLFNSLRNALSQKSARRPARPAPAARLQVEGLEERLALATNVYLNADLAAKEGGSYKIYAYRDGDVSQAMTVNYGFYGDGSAKPGSDYTGYVEGKTASFAAGKKSALLTTVKVIDDKVDEYDSEGFQMWLSLPDNSPAKITNGLLTARIADNDASPNLRIDALSASKNENDGNAYFRVSLDAASEKTVKVNFEGRSNGFMQFGKDAYFLSNGVATGASQTRYFNPGQTSFDVLVGINDDKIIEAAEYLDIALMSATNITGYHTVKATTVINDNDVPTIEIDDARPVYEGNGTAVNASFKVRLKEEAEREVKVALFTAAGDANSTSDYVSTRGQLTFGKTSTMTHAKEQTVNIAIRGDKIEEPTAENFYLGIGPIDSTAANKIFAPRTYGKGTIVDDDASAKVGIPTPGSAVHTPKLGFGMVVYNWSAASGAVRYEIYLRKENSFHSEFYDTYDGSDPEHLSGSITGTSFSPVYTSWQDPGTYFWKVRGVAADGTIGDWSGEQRFVVDY